MTAEQPSVWEPWWKLRQDFFMNTATELPCFLATQWQVRLMRRISCRDGVLCPFQDTGRGYLLFGIPVYITEPNLSDEMAIPALLATLART